MERARNSESETHVKKSNPTSRTEIRHKSLCYIFFWCTLYQKHKMQRICQTTMLERDILWNQKAQSIACLSWDFRHPYLRTYFLLLRGGNLDQKLQASQHDQHTMINQNGLLGDFYYTLESVPRAMLINPSVDLDKITKAKVCLKIYNWNTL